MSEEILSIVLLIIQMATLIALIVYVWKTWEMASSSQKSTEISRQILQEMKESRKEEIAPYVIVFFDIPYGTGRIYLCVKNVGKSVARNVMIHFQPPLSNSRGKEIADIPLLKQGASVIFPEYELRTFFDMAYAYFGNKELPRVYEVKVAYSGGLESERREEQFTVDLTSFEGLIYMQEYSMHDLVNEIKCIKKILKEHFPKLRL